MSESPPNTVSFTTPLETELVGSRVLSLPEVDSTNDCALRLGGHGIVIVSESQRAGRGRHGRSWHSAPGLGLWFSIGFEGRIEGLGFAAALAVRDSLAPRCPVSVKWPNDLTIAGRKVCGILVEHKRDRTALGIGINVHHQAEDFPEPLRDTATSLELATGQPWDRNALLRDVLTRLDRQVALLLRGGYETIRSQWAEACDLKGRRVRFDGTEAVVAEIDGDGALIVATPAGRRRVMSGEVTLAPGN